MTIMPFGHKSFVTHMTGLKERIEKAEKEIQMRKYRGLTKEGKWVYGWYVGEGYKCGRIIPTSDGYGSYGSTDRHKTMIGPVIEVIPETVGQQVGKLDIKQKEMYGGDIVRANNWEFEIVWQGLGWGLKGIKHGWWRSFHEFSHIEIIGTIHTHPELIEGKEDE